MENVASRVRLMIAELVSHRVPLVYRESINGRFVSITTGSGVPVLTLSREVAVEAGISPHILRPTPKVNRPLPAIDSRGERCISRQEVCMPSIQPIQWDHPGTAPAILKPLLERGGGVVENVIVRLSRDQRFPIRGARYRLAKYALVGEVPFWIDVMTQRPLYPVSGYKLAE
ncbi:hypothetical protein [Burkholderia stagnalis]|uniref:hypothetical protein n=1 Tax=Burkholderia stagnalis TaxID=1503054 RepID=UPI000F5C0232|nr:hypothetical protein [Burkholderia stagnalis]RQP98065.1 hypothetical protein DF164_31705 [Burkholderia stagnalis]RQY68849.1 hypothetical protein DF110_18605 [Burkholderia stagnalis]